MSPAERLADRRSPRLVTVEQLADAFWVRKTMKAHRRTGEVDLPGGLVRVPPRLAGLRVRLCWDPADPGRIRLIEAGGSEIPLTPIGPTPTPKLPVRPKSHGYRWIRDIRNR